MGLLFLFSNGHFVRENVFVFYDKDFLYHSVLLHRQLHKESAPLPLAF